MEIFKGVILPLLIIHVSGFAITFYFFVQYEIATNKLRVCLWKVILIETWLIYELFYDFEL